MKLNPIQSNLDPSTTNQIQSNLNVVAIPIQTNLNPTFDTIVMVNSNHKWIKLIGYLMNFLN